MSEEKKTGIALLRTPFPPHQIGKMPKPTKEQTDIVKADFKKGIRCDLCGAWHHPQVVHLDYVGHAALTDRLLDADPKWYWEPLALTPEGLPRFDANGGLWIKLTVDGVTRLGYGNAENSNFKEIGSREKEVIGDALRNAGMRFGAALELWHKGDLHLDDVPPPTEPKTETKKATTQPAAKETARSQAPAAPPPQEKKELPLDRDLTAMEKVELSKWVMPGGKFKGKAFGSVPEIEMKAYHAELMTAHEKGQELSPGHQLLLERIAQYYFAKL